MGAHDPQVTEVLANAREVWHGFVATIARLDPAVGDGRSPLAMTRLTSTDGRVRWAASSTTPGEAALAPDQPELVTAAIEHVAAAMRDPST